MTFGSWTFSWASAKILTAVFFFLSCLLIFTAKAVGHKIFTPDIFTGSLLCMAKYPAEHGGKSILPADTEALIYVMMDNNRDKWAANLEFYRESGHFGAKLPVKSTKHNIQPAANAKHHDAKYTSKDLGQAKYGTLNDEGMDLFTDLTKEIVDKKKDPKARKKMFKLERDFFKNHLPGMLEEQNKRKATTNAENAKPKRARRNLRLESDDEDDFDGFNSDELASDDEDSVVDDEEETKEKEEDDDDDDDDEDLFDKDGNKIDEDGNFIDENGNRIAETDTAPNDNLQVEASSSTAAAAATPSEGSDSDTTKGGE